nr:uncharacterized protein LOC122272975 [Parasteatoda tepidariorum]
MSAIEITKAKRTTVRKLTAQLINQIDAKLKSADEIDEQDLRDDYENLIEKSSELKQLDSVIESSLTLEQVEKEVTNNEECKTKCLKYSKRILRYLETKCKVNPTLNEPHNRSLDTSLSENLKNQCSIKLPKLVIEPFSGDPKQWNSFWNSFSCSIDKNEYISKEEKFSYLKSYLTGQAANVVTGFELSSANYDNCIKILKDRFGKRDIIINAFMNKILSLEEV